MASASTERATGRAFSTRRPAANGCSFGMNPCPCGYYGDSVRACVCAPGQVNRYAKRISGPLMDRIDLHVEVPRVDYDKLAGRGEAGGSAIVRERVQAARDRRRG